MHSRTKKPRTLGVPSLTTLLCLTACAAPEDDDLIPEAHALVAAPTPAPTPFVEAVGDAENATFSADGRLFVTGGANAYEIVKQGAGFAATPLYAGQCNFTGIATRGDHLYASCVEGTELANLKPHLLGASLSAPGPLALQVIHDFAKNKFPNGLAFDAAGRLFSADFSPLAGKIVTLSLDPAAPLKIAREDVWQTGGTLVNGLKVFEGKVYVTDAGTIKAIPIAPNGSAGRPVVLVTRLTVFDDLHVDARGIIAADFVGRRLVFFSLAGKFLKQTEPLFDTPSSVTPGRAPLVPEGALVVTEKGALNELTSDDGNRVSLFFP